MDQRYTTSDKSNLVVDDHCPSQGEISAFAEGRLPEPASSSIFRHLTRCTRCEETLLRLEEESSGAGRLLVPESNDLLDQEPECLRLQVAAKALGRTLGRGMEDASQESTDTTHLTTKDVPHDVPGPVGEQTTTCLPVPPARIGRYQVRSLLGEGSYGRVYLADDPELDRQVALKVPKFGPNVSRSLIDAFLREAKIAARLKHPGIVMVYDAGFDQKAGCFIVMEYVEGRSLKQLLSAGKVPHEQAAKYVAQAAEAVHYAHKQGLVHRDLKPANLLIDANGNLKVADFGLAIFEEEQRERAGEFAGTMSYVSPEQLRGEVHHLDGRTDIWSLGVIFYELLTGRRPFNGKHEVLTDEILHRPPKPPRQIDDTIPAVLERVCLKCLAKEASARFLTAKDLNVHLHRALQPRRELLVIATCTCLVLAILFAGALAAGSYFGGEHPSVASKLDESQDQFATTSVGIPYDVDPIAEPFVPLHLLTRKPRFPFPLTDDTFEFDEDAEELTLKSEGFLFAGVGRTESNGFRIAVKISKRDTSGMAGIYLCSKPMEKARHSDCQVVFARYGENGSACILRKHLVIHALSDSNYLVDQDNLALTYVTGDIGISDLLEVVIKDDHIAAVNWRGQSLPSLSGPILNSLETTRDATGEFGVVNFHGSATFHHLTFSRFGSAQP